MADTRYCVLSLICVTIFFTTLTCQELNENESIDVTRIKREGVPENRDLTVLLVNDQNRNEYNTKVGRYHSVKPLIGLLTSTARTFIQDGVTTEFATQILGTTLDNGRIYAQLLTKSSLVLYNKPSSVDDPFVVKPTRVHSAFDGEWNVKQDLGIIDPEKFILKNTDYLAPSSKMEIVYASKPAQEAFKFWNPPSSPDYQSDNQIDELTARKAQSYEPKFEVYNYLDGPAIENENKNIKQQPNIIDSANSLHRQNKAYEPVSEAIQVDSRVHEDVLHESNIVKVKPSYDLPTFTIKNEFSPIFYYIDNVESRYSPQQSLPQTKVPKQLFGHKSEPRPKKTFTYAGFADFTTVVGDTVIIFTPNTDTVRPPNPDEVNVFPSAKPVDKLATKITFLSADIPVATSTFKAHEANSATKLPTSDSDENRSEKALYNDEESLKKVLYEVDDKIPDTVSVQYNNGFDLNLDVIQPSEPAYTTTESTRYTEDLDKEPVKEFNFQATDPLSSLMPSATTTFGDEESKESAVTEANVKNTFTNSEEETENTAAEVTEKASNEEEEAQEDDSTQEPETDVQTTTESGHSDESYEIETTTESKYDKHEEVFCSNGLETQSTMTTEYKTLTYLTTYFIPLESTETTTSIKSDVVVESNVGYITNYICQTDLAIEPTSVVSIDAGNTERSNLEQPEVVSQSEINPLKEPESVTDNPSKTTLPMEKEDFTTPQDQEDKSSQEKDENSESIVTQNDSLSTTTTERVSTSQSHIKVSVSTEQTPTETTNSEEEDSENEIDLIYKTLYTTYTYFTTFFGDQTSSVASHKSVVTNIITSTIDLSKLDPSLLGAFDEDEIAPTSVGTGRPTESFAINSIIDLVKNKDVIESVEIDKSYSSQTPTPSLGDDFISSIKPDTVKTYYTTYTFFTTIYVGSDANVCSRSEVYTNYVGPDELIPTKTNPLSVESTKAQFDFRNCKQIKGMASQSIDDNSSVESTVSLEQNHLEEIKEKESTPQPTPIEVDMLFSVESSPLSENSFVTDVKSSSSKENTNKLAQFKRNRQLNKLESIFIENTDKNAFITQDLHDKTRDITRFDNTDKADVTDDNCLTVDWTLLEDPRFQYDGSIPTFASPTILGAFNTNAIVYDNTPWRPGREIDIEQKKVEDEGKVKNLATRIMSNGVEVLVRDKSAEGKQEQRKYKLLHLAPLKQSNNGISSTPPFKSLLSSAVATVVNRQEMSAFFPLHQLMQHNYIIKTCMTTYTYLTTVVQNKRSAVSTFETIVSVVTTESLTNLYATDVFADIKPTKTKYMEVKTIQPSATNMYINNYPKLDKRIDNEEEHNFDLIQPSEISHSPCTTSCTCSHTKTESLKTKYSNVQQSSSSSDKYQKHTKYSGTKLDVRPTHKEILNKTQYRPYEYETGTQTAPTDKIVEKYTQVTDYLDDRDPSSVETSDLLTNEQAPPPLPVKTTTPANKTSENNKPERPPKVNKNKYVMAELIKLGSLGIKSLSQLAPVIEKMTGGFMKKQESNKTATTTTTTTVKPVTKVIQYSANKRVDSDVESKHGNFPIYIPVDEMETSETQVAFTNATLHQNFVWASDHKYTKGHFMKPKIVHESPLVNGGIPISPGEIITANSDVIVGKPAVGGPLTLGATGIKLQNPVNPPLIDSAGANNEQYISKVKPPPNYTGFASNGDDSFDLRPPELPKLKSKPNKSAYRPQDNYYAQQNSHITSSRVPVLSHVNNEPHKYPVLKKHNGPILVNHGRPAFLDFIPSLKKPPATGPIHHHSVNYRPNEDSKDNDIPDNNPSSSEIVSTKVITDGKYQIVDSPESDDLNKPFLVDIQPSKVANVLIPHGSSTALVFAGSSEPHKTGDYVDDPLPYPEPGYFGSFSIDAPHMTNVHNVVPNNNLFVVKPNVETFNNNLHPYKDIITRNENKFQLSENKRPKDLNKLPPPTSNQESHIQVGPKITAYNPDTSHTHHQTSYENYKHKGEKEVIDKEYENYLAVPPPPPPKRFNQENKHDKNKAYQHHSSFPVTHTKPVQDSKVFVNVQHPVPNQLPPKVTSEIYFASQLPNSQPTPTYTFKIPQSPHHSGNNVYHNNPSQTNNQPYKPGTSNHNAVSTANNVVDTSLSNSDLRENTYTVTLNAATNLANKPGHIFGSSITIPITTTSDNGQINANIPIGTNFAIRVEDDPTKYESVAHGKRHPSLNYNEHVNVPFNNLDSFTVGTLPPKVNSSQSSDNKENAKDKNIKNDISPVITTSMNSHANFPMMNEEVHFSANLNPVINYDNNKYIHKINKKPQPKYNVSTNSHGWYSSVLNEGNVKNIVVESTSRKNIPLNYDDNNDSLPEFGEKIATVGKPPAGFWDQNKQSVNNFGVGQPFSKPKEDKKPVSIFSIRPNYIPSNYGAHQPTYDIPLRDSSEETTTSKTVYQKPIKPVYETAEEIYDGEEGPEVIGETDGEVSSESMSVPFVSSSNERKNSSTISSAATIPQTIDPSKMDHTNKSVQLIDFNPGTQTEKPFSSYNKTTFQSNSINPVYGINHNIFMKPRPFTIQTPMPLDHQLQQPHWQINELLENATNNMSYEDNFELNTGEEMNIASTDKPNITGKPLRPLKKDGENKAHSKPRDPILLNSTRIVNESNIITSTVHIKDKKPITVEVDEKSTLPSFTISSQTNYNSTSSEILDLSPPPPNMEQNYKPSKADEIMGMSPPPPRTPSPRYPLRPTQTSRPVLPIRTPPPYRTLPPRTLPPRQSTPRPIRKPGRDEVSTYKPSYEITNKIKRPSVNFDQPSSLLLPPPREQPSQHILSEKSSRKTSVYSPPASVIFPTPLSSSWLTSSNIGFSSSFNFAPTSVYFPDTVSQYQDKPDKVTLQGSTENGDDSYEYESSSENVDVSYENPVTEKKMPIYKPVNRTQPLSNVVKVSTPNVNIFSDGDIISSESSQEDSVKNKPRNTTLGNRNRTRKPYPIRSEDKKSSTIKLKLPSKTVPVIKPSKTIYRPEVSYPTRISSIKKIIRPLPSRPLAIFPSSVIESSESSMEEDFIRPTEVLKDVEVPTLVPEITSIIEKTITSTLTISKDILDSSIKPTHHAGNEIKISDEILPTKTEFKTTVITLTKTLSEPPRTVSSIGYVNLTQTLTVTHTKTSLVSQSEGAVRQTLVVTNTHTSTIVDVVTEIYTEVQPTTIVETVTKHIPIPQVEATSVVTSATNTKIALDDITMSSEESDNFIIRDNDVTENIQKIEEDKDNDTFFVVMNKSQNGGKAPPINTDIETGDFDITRNEQVNSNGVSQVLFGEILLAGTPYLETVNVARPTVTGYGKECQPDCKASRNERCQRIEGIMKCVCRPGFARMFPDRPCKPTYTYSVRLALGSQGNGRLKFQKNLVDNSTKEYQSLAVATHEGINRMIMQSDLRDVYHGVHITGFHPVDMRTSEGEVYEGVINDFYVQLSDNAHESRLKEVIEKYLRNNNYSLGGTEVHAADQLMDRLNVSDFDECISTQFHDCSEHARCFNLRGTYTCSCLEGYADLSVNTLYPGRICSSDAVGCGGCNYHGTCFERETTTFCECFKWYAGRTCQVNLKAVLITVTVIGAVVILVVTIWASKRCCYQRGPATQTFVIGCMQGMPSLHQGTIPSKQRADRRALIAERAEAAETCSVQNTSLPYVPSKQSRRSTCSKKCVMSDPPAHAPPPPPAPALMIPRARLHPAHSDSRDNLARKKSSEIISEAKLISYLESGASNVTEDMRRKHSVESSYSVNKERHNKQGALVSAGFKVSTTVRPDENSIKEDRDDASSINKTDLEAEMSRFDTLREYNSQEDMSEWTDAERRIGELTLSEARSVGGTLPASTGRAASSTRLTHQEAHTMAERDLGSTFLLPHVHLYKPDLTSDVSEFDSL